MTNSFIDSVSSQYGKEILELYRTIDDGQRFKQAKIALGKLFIARHISNYYGLYRLNMMLKREPQELDYVESMLTKVNKDLQNTSLYKTTEVMLKFKVGKKFPDFKLPDTANNVTHLTGLLKSGRYLLVDFWASWCLPCRKEHPFLREAYNKYKASGFDIVGISLDDNEHTWKAAIEQDKLTWTNLSDLLGMKKGISKEFFITAVPTNFLVDENGIIIAKDLRGKELEMTLQKLLEATKTGY